MARIVYGLSGEGSGHSSRSQQMARHLVTQGHEVKLASYDRGYRNLKGEFDILEIEGLVIASENNKVSKSKTLAANLGKLSAGLKTFRRLKKSLFEEFQPDVVITDFEPMTAYLAYTNDLPLITIDNQHRMRYMQYDGPAHLNTDRRLTKGVIRAMVPRPDVSLVITFYEAPATNRRTLFFPPILRDEVLAAQPTEGDHILVYLSFGFDDFIEQLKQFPNETFRVYGYDREAQDGNLYYRPFSKEGFMSDLASSKAVMATAGFTLISEALWLKKPMLALPMAGQFEQQLNGHCLEQMGLGKNAPEPTQEAVGDFLYRLPEYRTSLAQHEARDNTAILNKLDELLADDCALAREFHANRKAYAAPDSA